MALVTRYFSTTSAGAGDGTTWADRAALFSAGVWSSVVTGFNFTGGDSLVCRVEGSQTYTCGQLLTGAVFTSGAPANGAQLVFVACDSSGDEKPAPNPGWVSAQPVWDATGMPIIATSTDISTAAVGYFYGFKFTASGRTTGSVTTGAWLFSCIVDQGSTGTSTSLAGVSGGHLHNSAVVMSGTGYYAITLSGASGWNTRFQGNSAAGTGLRRGLETTGSITGCTVIVFAVAYNCVVNYGANPIHNCVILGGTGVVVSSTSVTTIRDSVLTGSSGYGLTQSGAGVCNLVRCRLRDNTSGATNTTGAGELLAVVNDTSAGSDAAEFVDAASGDYRIKYGSALWGKGIGAGDGPATITG